MGDPDVAELAERVGKVGMRPDDGTAGWRWNPKPFIDSTSGTTVGMTIEIVPYSDQTPKAPPMLSQADVDDPQQLIFASYGGYTRLLQTFEKGYRSETSNQISMLPPGVDKTDLVGNQEEINVMLIQRAQSKLKEYDNMENFVFLPIEGRCALKVTTQYGNINNVPSKPGMLYIEIKLVGRRNPLDVAERKQIPNGDLLIKAFTVVAQPPTTDNPISFSKQYGDTFTVEEPFVIAGAGQQHPIGAQEASSDMMNSFFHKMDDRNRRLRVDVYACDDGKTGYPDMDEHGRPIEKTSHKRLIRTDYFNVDYRWRSLQREKWRSPIAPSGYDRAEPYQQRAPEIYPQDHPIFGEWYQARRGPPKLLKPGRWEKADGFRYNEQGFESIPVDERNGIMNESELRVYELGIWEGIKRMQMIAIIGSKRIAQVIDETPQLKLSSNDPASNRIRLELDFKRMQLQKQNNPEVLMQHTWIHTYGATVIELFKTLMDHSESDTSLRENPVWVGFAMDVAREARWYLNRNPFKRVRDSDDYRTNPSYNQWRIDLEQVDEFLGDKLPSDDTEGQSDYPPELAELDSQEQQTRYQLLQLQAEENSSRAGVAQYEVEERRQLFDQYTDRVKEIQKQRELIKQRLGVSGSVPQQGTAPSGEEASSSSSSAPAIEDPPQRAPGELPPLQIIGDEEAGKPIRAIIFGWDGVFTTRVPLTDIVSADDPRAQVPDSEIINTDVGSFKQIYKYEDQAYYGKDVAHYRRLSNQDFIEMLGGSVALNKLADFFAACWQNDTNRPGYPMCEIYIISRDSQKESIDLALSAKESEDDEKERMERWGERNKASWVNSVDLINFMGRSTPPRDQFDKSHIIAQDAKDRLSYFAPSEVDNSVPDESAVIQKLMAENDWGPEQVLIVDWERQAHMRQPQMMPDGGYDMGSESVYNLVANPGQIFPVKAYLRASQEAYSMQPSSKAKTSPALMDAFLQDQKKVGQTWGAVGHLQALYEAVGIEPIKPLDEYANVKPEDENWTEEQWYRIQNDMDPDTGMPIEEEEDPGSPGSQGSGSGAGPSAAQTLTADAELPEDEED